MEHNCGTCRYGDKTSLVTKRTHCSYNNYWAFSHESCGYWEERQGTIIDSDDTLAYESFYCNRCVNKPDPDPPACPCYELLVQYGCVTGYEYDRAVQDILRMFFPPHPTAKGKLDQCTMFAEKKVCEDCQHWKLWNRGSDKHYCDSVEEKAKGIEDFFIPVLFTNGVHPIYGDDHADCWLWTDAKHGCHNWEAKVHALEGQAFMEIHCWECQLYEQCDCPGITPKTIKDDKCPAMIERCDNG